MKAGRRGFVSMAVLRPVCSSCVSGSVRPRPNWPLVARCIVVHQKQHRYVGRQEASTANPSSLGVSTSPKPPKRRPPAAARSFTIRPAPLSAPIIGTHVGSCVSHGSACESMSHWPQIPVFFNSHTPETGDLVCNHSGVISDGSRWCCSRLVSRFTQGSVRPHRNVPR
jgi:hypothetical protein